MRWIYSRGTYQASPHAGELAGEASRVGLSEGEETKDADGQIQTVGKVEFQKITH